MNYYDGEIISELESKITELESQLQQTNEWISVENRLPELNANIILVCREDGDVMPVYFDGDDFIVTMFGMHQRYKEPKYWRELPKPPKGSE